MSYVEEALGNWGRGKSCLFDSCCSRTGLLPGVSFNHRLFEDDASPDSDTGRDYEKIYGDRYIPIEEISVGHLEYFMYDEDDEDFFSEEEAFVAVPVKDPHGWSVANFWTAVEHQERAEREILHLAQTAVGSSLDGEMVGQSSPGWLGKRGRLIVRGLVGHALIF